MAKTKTSRIAWGIAAILAMALLGGIGLLGVWLRCYWVARHRGQGADLEGTRLEGADLRGANLLGWKGREAANLTGARCDKDTRWPVGFDAAKQGAKLVR